MTAQGVNGDQRSEILRLRNALRSLVEPVSAPGPKGERLLKARSGIDLMTAVLKELGETVLPREVRLMRPDGGILRLHVANRRLVRLGLPLPQGLGSSGETVAGIGLSYAGATELEALRDVLLTFLGDETELGIAAVALPQPLPPEETGAAAETLAKVWALPFSARVTSRVYSMHGPGGTLAEADADSAMEERASSAVAEDGNSQTADRRPPAQSTPPVRAAAPVRPTPASGPAPDPFHPKQGLDLLNSFSDQCRPHALAEILLDGDTLLGEGGAEDSIAQLQQWIAAGLPVASPVDGPDSVPGCLILRNTSGQGFLHANVGMASLVIVLKPGSIGTVAQIWSDLAGTTRNV